jgi:hypothetical protein
MKERGKCVSGPRLGIESTWKEAFPVTTPAPRLAASSAWRRFSHELKLDEERVMAQEQAKSA